MRQANIGNVANAFYILGCILSLGAIWMFKVILEKAYIDADNKLEA